MPRRGEDRYDFPAASDPPQPHRIGRRVVGAADRTGVLRDIVLDPGEFRCSSLAAELADEWADYAAAAKLSTSAARVGRRAIRDFCGWADTQLSGEAPKASLAAQQPDLAAVLAEWERTLPSRHQAGSTTPSVLAATIRALVVRRAHHEKRPVAAGLVARRRPSGRACGPHPGDRRVLPQGQAGPRPGGLGVGSPLANPPRSGLGTGGAGPPPCRARLDRARRPALGPCP